MVSVSSSIVCIIYGSSLVSVVYIATKTWSRLKLDVFLWNIAGYAKVRGSEIA